MNAITRKRSLAGLALVGAVGITLAGCAAPPEEGEGAAEGSDFLACAVSDEGSWNDKSFNEAAYGGLTEAESELGIKINDAESQSTEDFQPNLQAMVDAACDVTFAVGFNFSENDTITTVANANPDSHFVWIDGWNSGETNLKPVTYEMAESSYLAGYLAADYSTTKVLGTYGGLDIPAVTVFMDGFIAGAEAWAEENGTDVTVLGRDSFTEGFGDAGGAKSISLGQLAEGADVILPVAGGLFASTAEAITESGKDAVFMGVDKDVALTSPEYEDMVLTSVEKRMTQAVLDIITDLEGGADFSIDPYVGTLENDGTALSDFYAFDDKISDETKAKLEELKQGIIDGSIVPVPAS